jgi:very-short-patch-repair endonuclease
MDLTGPFRGSAAVACGALTRNQLAGPRFRRLFPDIYVPAALEVDLAVRSLAAALLVAPSGVLSGYSAAELLGASCAPPGAPAEMTVPPTCHRRRLEHLLVHRGHLDPSEIVVVGGTAMTSAPRTAFDLVCWNTLVEAVVAVDALARAWGFDPGELRALRSAHLGARGAGTLEAVLRLVDARAESPMETRIRVALVLAGLPPCVQHPVTAQGRNFRLDLAYPAALLAVEYDGGHHRDAEQALADLEREALLTALGWKVLRFRAAAVLFRPRVLAARVGHELRQRDVIAACGTSDRA